MRYGANEIRSGFIRFFQERGHRFVPSSPLLPAGDPTLLFANAGMNQFKDFFLGTAKPDAPRVANSQKCIRAGGKHNDLEDVGHDTFHHTFFEMLGNWSFGDYFKKEAIAWAWELLTGVWKLPKERLHATVFEGDPAERLPADEEAAELWRTVTDIDPSHIGRHGQKDNFWEMGETGPCGPCSEIHIDLGQGRCDGSGHPDRPCGVNAPGCERFIEFWNLVFMEFNRGADGKLMPLPARHVDTGMGLERICRILQGVKSNYDTDIFRGIIEAAQRHSPAGPYTGKLDDLKDVAYRVVADHARALTFAIADGVIPSNEGRGYVLRRILRRAARYGRQYLRTPGPILWALVPTIAESMGDAFPEIRQRQKYVMATMGREEEAFWATIDRGIAKFQREATWLQSVDENVFPGETAFDLHATDGFPVDLTQVMAAELGMKVDMAGFEKAMAEHREVSRGEGDRFKVEAVVGLPVTDDSPKYAPSPLEATVLGWVRDNEFVAAGELTAGEEAAVVLDRTNFYGEQGGQVGDGGTLSWAGGQFTVGRAVPAGDCVLHVGRLSKGTLKAGQQVTAAIAPARLYTMRNHTATHLLNWALRGVLGEHVHQAGSVVGPDRLRFDFAHNQAVAQEQLAEVERRVNERIRQDLPVRAKAMPLEEARKIPGVQAVFGERYPDPVRVISIGGTGETPVAPPSAEFCGGTHCTRTGQIGLFKIVGEESVAKGVRRITAVTGEAAVRHVQEMEWALRLTTDFLRVRAADVPGRVEAMQKELRQLRKAGPAGASDLRPQAELDTPHGRVVVAQVDTADPAAMRTLCDVQRQRGAAAVLLGGAANEKVTLVAMVSEELAGAGALTASQWVQAAAEVVGGRGGGKPTLAQAGGRDVDKLPQALAAAADWATQRLK